MVACYLVVAVGVMVQLGSLGCVTEPKAKSGGVTPSQPSPIKGEIYGCVLRRLALCQQHLGNLVGALVVDIDRVGAFAEQ